MSNIERAAEVIEQAVFRDGFGIRLTAKSLADAGLLAPDLPDAPNRLRLHLPKQPTMPELPGDPQ